MKQINYVVVHLTEHIQQTILVVNMIDNISSEIASV